MIWKGSLINCEVSKGIYFPCNYLIIFNSTRVYSTTCIELPKTSKCYGLQTQRPNYYLPQTLSFGQLFTDDNIVLIMSLSTSQVPIECKDRIVGVFCTALYPPCDNVTNLPILQCPASCEKYRSTVNDTQCTFLWNYLIKYISIVRVVSLLQQVNCSDPSTYYFGDTSNGFSNTSCYSSFNDLPQTTGGCKQKWSTDKRCENSLVSHSADNLKIILPTVIIGTTVLVTVVTCVVLVVILRRRRGSKR